MGSGIKLSYLESGVLLDQNHVTVVDGLHFDLYSAVSSAKRGISAVIDFDINTGENKSFTYCKQTGEAFPLTERKQLTAMIQLACFLVRIDIKALLPLTSLIFLQALCALSHRGFLASF